MWSDETSPLAGEIEGLLVTVPQTVTHVLLGRQDPHHRLHPPLSVSSSTPFSLHLTAAECDMLCFYALHGLLVLCSHCNTAVFQHTNNWGAVGDPPPPLPPRCAASHPGVTACQGTVSPQPQLHFPGSARPAFSY